MRRGLAILAAALLVFGLPLSACGAPAEPGSSAGEPDGLEAPIAGTPVLLTSVGQSPDVEMVRVLLERVHIEPVVDNRADGSQLHNARTLVLAVGGSAKGMGAAGIALESEVARVEQLTAAADEAGMTIIAIHLGGTARRGDLSDQLIVPCFERADYAIVVRRGDRDRFMAGLAAQREIPMDYTETIVSIEEPLAFAFSESPAP